MAILLNACTPTTHIRAYMQTYKHSLAYLHDSPVRDKTVNIAVRINNTTMRDGAIRDTLLVDRKFFIVVPVLLVTYAMAVHDCELGANVVRDPLVDFSVASLAAEAERSGVFSIDTAGEAEYSLEISLDSIRTVGPYVSSGTAVVTPFSFHLYRTDYAGPAQSCLYIRWRLIKNGETLLDEQINASREASVLRVHNRNVRKLCEDYTAAMVEAVSLNFKALNEQIVGSINDYFAN